MADLVTVAELANFTGEDIENADAAAAQAVAHASAVVRAHLGYTVTQDTYTELCDPVNGSFVALAEAPVVAVLMVELYDRYNDAWNVLPPTAFVQSKRTGILQGLGGRGYYFPTWPESWRVTYTAGWAATPDAIKLVTLGIAARILFSPSGIKSERLGGYSATYESGALTPVEIMALRPYTRAVIG